MGRNDISHLHHPRRDRQAELPVGAQGDLVSSFVENVGWLEKEVSRSMTQDEGVEETNSMELTSRSIFFFFPFLSLGLQGG